MDRQIVYPGSIPLDTDFLTIQRNTLIALSALAKTVLGSAPVVDGLVCSPTGAGYSVSMGPGTLSVLESLDATPFGSLSADATQILKTGVNLASSTLQLGVSPDQGSVLCWLIQATLQDQDDQPLALQYWNANNPTIPFSGPGNSGTPQNTRRATKIVFSTKSSAPLQLGTFVPPSADPGWIGLYGVTTWVGRPAVISSDIQVLPGAPILPYYLPDLTPGFSRQIPIATTQTWTVPASVTRIRVRVVGAGGGGGGGTGSYGGGGGGAGGYAEAIVGVTPGHVYSVVVGAGGAPGGPGSSGGDGGLTDFGPGLATAQGGHGGASNNPDSHGGMGGVGLAGTLLIGGGLGGDGPTVANVPAGNGGVSAFGGGGRGSNGGGLPANGMAPGSGAGGAYGNPASGGQGAAGIVILEY